MLVSGKFFAALLAAAAAGVTGSPAELKERDTSPYPYVCTDSDFLGNCIFPETIKGECFGLDQPFYHTLSSINPYDKSYALYKNYNCQSDDPIVIDSETFNLEDRNFNDIAGGILWP